MRSGSSPRREDDVEKAKTGEAPSVKVTGRRVRGTRTEKPGELWSGPIGGPRGASVLASPLGGRSCGTGHWSFVTRLPQPGGQFLSPKQMLKKLTSDGAPLWKWTLGRERVSLGIPDAQVRSDFLRAVPRAGCL